MTAPPPPAVSDEHVARAVAQLRDGGLVCIPTETTYGIAADIRDPSALAALVALKGRDPRAPFALIAADLEQARSVARDWPALADELAKRYWPGPLTLVVPARAGLPSALLGLGGGVGVRVPSHPAPAALARALGGPITATSANPAGLPPALDVATARRYFGDALLYLDCGPATHVSASTVAAVGVAEPGPASDAPHPLRVLRPGPVDLSEYLARDP